MNSHILGAASTEKHTVLSFPVFPGQLHPFHLQGLFPLRLLLPDLLCFMGCRMVGFHTCWCWPCCTSVWAVVSVSSTAAALWVTQHFGEEQKSLPHSPRAGWTAPCRGQKPYQALKHGSCKVREMLQRPSKFKSLFSHTWDAQILIWSFC